jgi:hypothetical protein
MYSPKISEELIPVLYKIAKVQKIPMTRLVDQIIEESLKKFDLKSLEKQWVQTDISKDFKRALYAILCVLGRNRSKR